MLKRIVYVFVFAFLCVIDHLSNSMSGAAQMTFINLTGVALLLLFFVQYPLRDYKTVHMLVWTVFCVIGIPVAIVWGSKNYQYVGQWVTGVINVALLGYAVILAVKGLVKSERRKKSFGALTFAICWGIEVIAIIFSRYDGLWPIWFAALFFLLYMTPFSREEIGRIIESACEGIVLAFFLIQGSAFVFRPFDFYRYNGMYTNSNLNALFYLLSYCAFLMLWKLSLDKKKKGWLIFYSVMSPALVTFTFFTGSKTAVLAEAVITAVFLIILGLSDGKRWLLSVLKRVAYWVLIFVVSIPLVYCSIRYLPAFFHHPVWLWNEYSESKVHSFDPIDSKKYISPKEALAAFTDRFLWFAPEISFGYEEEKEAVEETIVESVSDAIVEEDLENDAPEDEPDYTPGEERMVIWKGYLSKTDFRGHKRSESGFQMSKDYVAPHAHNVFIEAMFDFGIIGGGIFLVLAAFSLVYALYQCFFVKNSPEGLFELLFITAFCLFGFFEIDWREGQLALTMFLFCQFITGKGLEERLCKSK